MKNKYLITAVTIAAVIVIFLIAGKPHKNLKPAPSVTPQEVAPPRKAPAQNPRLSINAIKGASEEQKADVSVREDEKNVNKAKAQSAKSSGSANTVSGSTPDEVAAPSAQKEQGLQSTTSAGYQGVSSVGGGGPGGSGSTPVNAIPSVDAMAKMIKKENDRRNEYRDAVAAIDAQRAANREELRREAENPPILTDTTPDQSGSCNFLFCWCCAVPWPTWGVR